MKRIFQKLLFCELNLLYLLWFPLGGYNYGIYPGPFGDIHDLYYPSMADIFISFKKKSDPVILFRNSLEFLKQESEVPVFAIIEGIAFPVDNKVYLFYLLLGGLLTHFGKRDGKAGNDVGLRSEYEKNEE